MQGLVIDLFAGGGGASVGIEAALGRPIDVAIKRTRGSKREFGEEGGRPRARRSSPGALPRGARWRQRG